MSSPFAGKWETQRSDGGSGCTTVWFVEAESDPDVVAGVWSTADGWGLVSGTVAVRDGAVVLDGRWIAPEGSHGLIRLTIEAGDPSAFVGRWQPTCAHGRPGTWDGRKVGDLGIAA